MMIKYRLTNICKIDLSTAHRSSSTITCCCGARLWASDGLRSRVLQSEALASLKVRSEASPAPWSLFIPLFPRRELSAGTVPPTVQTRNFYSLTVSNSLPNTSKPHLLLPNEKFPYCRCVMAHVACFRLCKQHMVKQFNRTRKRKSRKQSQKYSHCLWFYVVYCKYYCLSKITGILLCYYSVMWFFF